MVDLTLAREAAADVGAGGFALDVMDDVLPRSAARARSRTSRASAAPVWIVNGQYDHFRGEERRFLRACRDGRLVVLRRARHLASLDAPVGFTRVLLEALDGARGARGCGRLTVGTAPTRVATAGV